ncbi:g10808 [Coccomyxa elongata]
MAASAEDTLRQLLAHFQVAALEDKTEEQRLGLKDRDRFHSSEEIKEFAQDENFGDVADAGMHVYLLRFAGTYVAMKDLATILARSLPRPNMETTSRSFTQVDVQRDKHPQSVQLWDGLDAEVQRHKDSKKKTKPRFISNRLVDRGPATQYCVSEVFDSEIRSVINAGIKYWTRKGYLEQGGKVYSLWEPQESSVKTDSEAWEEARATGQDEIDDATREALEQESAVRARRAILTNIQPNIYIGRVLCRPGKVDPPWCNADDPPDLVALWNQPTTPDTRSVKKDVVSGIEQWIEYASDHGIRFGLIFTHMWTWALQADGANNLYISPVYRYDAVKPTVLEVVDFITHRALGPDGTCDPWTPSKQQPPFMSVINPSEGPATRKRSRTAAQQPPLGDGAEGPSGSILDAGSLGLPQSVHPGGTCAQHKEAMRLAQAAAAFRTDWLMGVLGRGAVGEVFWGRMPCGRKVALKVAASGYREEEMLRNEANAYLAIQDLWNKGVPGLLLAGDLCAIGGGYGLGTSVLPGRPLQPGDAELLPEAHAILKQIHSKGVIHGDLRPENFVVMEPDVARDPAGKTIFVLDFSHAKYDRSQEAQRSEICSLQKLFQSL